MSIPTSSRTLSPAPGSSSPIATWARASRYLGPQVPQETLIWQDPIPAVDHPLIDDAGHRRAQGEGPGLRAVGGGTGLDGLGLGLDLPRLRQARRRQRRAHPAGAAKGLGGQPARQLAKVLKALEGIQAEFNAAQRAARRFRWPT